MKKLTILSLALLAVFALTGIASAFGESNAPNANLNARVSRGFTPERNAVKNVTGMVRTEIRNTANRISEKAAAISNTVNRIEDTVTSVSEQHLMERTANEIQDNARNEYNSFNKNFNEVVQDQTVNLKNRFNNKITDISRRVKERVIVPIGNSVGNTVQNSGGSVSTTINAIFRRY